MTRALAPVHYITLYLMGEPVDVTLEEFRALGGTLREAGRFHAHRRSRPVRTLRRLRYRSRTPGARVGRGRAVPAQPGRVRGRARGDVVVVASAAPVDGRRCTTIAEALLGHDGVAGVWTFATDSRFDRHGWRAGDKTITVCYLDAAPLTLASRLGQVAQDVSAAPGRPVLFSGPFETITPWSWDWFDGEV